MTEDSKYRLVISEKPDAARRIASALGRHSRRENSGVEYLDVEKGFDGSHYVVCSASGHLYGLADPEMNRGIYPVFDVEWFPLSSIHSTRRAGAADKRDRPGFQRGFRTNFSLVSRKIRAISNLSRNASDFVHACDYDLEGETIGSNILKYACADSAGQKVQRAKFSTLTDAEIRSAFSSLEKMNQPLTSAGRMRHMIDFVWGVNVSRALTESIVRTTGRYQMLTMGRVQGPTLAFVVDRETEIMSHVPVPYWSITCKLEKNGAQFDASYERQKIVTKKDADTIFRSVSDASYAQVESLNKSEESRPPPYPFNLGDLQKEAYRAYRFSPSATLKCAEKLYLRALISYPRTDSQKLPQSIGYQQIINGLSRIQNLRNLVEEVQRETGPVLRPRQGPKEDYAHPAIFPTGEDPNPKRLDRMESLVYYLIARRFLAAFAKDALFEVVKATFRISGYAFRAKGESTIRQGWTRMYPFYGNLGKDESKLPELRVSDILNVKGAELVSTHEEKPPRFSESSLLSKMESEGIGTKATRAETISTLTLREYVVKDSAALRPTDLGSRLVETMEEYCPEIVSTKMTETVEKNIEGIAKAKQSELQVLSSTMSSLARVLSSIRKNQEEIGASFATTVLEQGKTKGYNKQGQGSRKRTLETLIGKCPVCGVGQLKVIRSRKTGKRFVGCSNYSNGCRASGPLPQRGLIKSAKSQCSSCTWPLVIVVYPAKARRAPWRLCPNTSCPSNRVRMNNLSPTEEVVPKEET